MQQIINQSQSEIQYWPHNYTRSSRSKTSKEDGGAMTQSDGRISFLA